MNINRTLIALAITLSLDATPDEVAAAHDAIDSIFDPDNSITAGQVAASQAGATSAAASVTAGGVQLDAEGLPWDERIHSSNKKLTAKNVWYGRRGVTPAQKVQVEGELRAALAAGGVSAPVASGPSIAAVSQPVLAASGPSLGVAGGAVQTPAPTAFEKLVAAIAKHTNSPANPTGALTETFVKSVLEWKAVPNGEIQNLAHMGDAVIGEIHAYIAEQLATKGVQF